MNAIVPPTREADVVPPATAVPPVTAAGSVTVKLVIAQVLADTSAPPTMTFVTDGVIVVTWADDVPGFVMVRCRVWAATPGSTPVRAVPVLAAVRFVTPAPETAVAVPEPVAVQYA